MQKGLCENSKVNWVLLFFDGHGRKRIQQKHFFHSSTMLASRGSIANAAISPGSKNHVTRTHPALQPKRLQIMDMMVMMALPDLNIDLLMMTMLVIWITMHLNSQGFDEPPAPYLRSIPFLFSAVLLMFGLAFQDKITPPAGLRV